VHIGAFHWRKVTARPLKELERTLGHRLHVEGRSPHHCLPGAWNFQAYNYLHTDDAALAVKITLEQLSRFATISVGLSGYNDSANDVGDLDDATIGAFYWGPPDQIGLPRYGSGGVLLLLAGHDRKYGGSLKDEFRRRARPIVPVAAPSGQRAGYVADFTVRIVCGNKQDVVAYHWPRFAAAHFPEGVYDVEIDNRTHAGKPNIIHVRQTLRGLQEHEAMAHCLTHAPNLKLSPARAEPFHFAGALPEHATYRDGFSSFVLTRADCGAGT